MNKIALTVEQAMSDLVSAQATFDDATKLLEASKARLAEFAPAKVGDVITVTGYNYTGKQMKVMGLSIIDRWRDGQLYFQATGYVLKANREPAESMIGKCLWNMQGESVKG